MTDLLLLPGLNCDAAAWAEVAARLPEARCTVARYAGERSLEAMAQAALAQAPARFALAGHSMGGRVALEILALAPERVSHAALLDTGCDPLPAGESGARERDGRRALLELAQREGMRAMGAVWLRGMLDAARFDDHALVAAILDMIARHTNAQFAAQVDALLARPDRRALLAALRLPVLVACGREDRWAPVAQHEAMAALVPGAQLAVFERCGHMAPMERPDAVADALQALLARPAAATPGARPVAPPAAPLTPQAHPDAAVR